LFAVNKGGQSISNSPFSAISATSSNMTFNIQVPSLNTFMDRAVTFTAGVKMKMTVDVGSAPGAWSGVQLLQPVVSFGSDVALCSFPLNSMMSTLQSTINTVTTSINSNDVLYEVLRLANQKKNRLMRTCPTMLDKYQDYNDAISAVNNPLSTYFNATDYDNVPNGAFWDIVFTDAAGVVLTAPYVVGGITYNVVNGIPVLSNNGGAAITSYPIFFKFRCTEKLVLSPFIFYDDLSDEEVGLYGIQNINLLLNFQTPSRLIRNAPLANSDFNKTVSNVNFLNNSPFETPRVNCLFITPNLSLSLPPVSIVPYYEYPRYISVPGTSIAAGVTAVLSSQTITLPQIPDMMIIYAKPSSYAQDEADYYFPITGINIQFDNFSGLMSSFTSEQLYNLSIENGLEMDWMTWNGAGRASLQFADIPNSVSNAGNVNLVGGFLVIKPGKDFALQPGQAPGVNF
jgi:hypothetical protein